MDLYFFQVMFRMNFLVITLCFVMNRPYQFYYFVPLVSFFFLGIYVTMAVWPHVTESSTGGKMSRFHSFVCYRPHPKDRGRLYFQFVCQFKPPAGTAVRVLATWRAVCLLRSRRRTFLLCEKIAIQGYCCLGKQLPLACSVSYLLKN